MNEIVLILNEIRPEFDFSSSSDFIAEGMLDSFDIIMLVTTLDKKYGISIDGIDIISENFLNIESITALIRKHGAKL